MKTETIVLGGGCFWCTEAVFQKVTGVTSIMSGYAGGTDERVNYYRVASGATGHAEVIRVEFDADSIPLETLLEIFFVMHDPTTLNQQGADVGTQYRSIILYTTEEQKTVIQEAIKTAQEKYADPIVTEVGELDTFFEAEEEHRDYYNQNKNRNPYCRVVIDPKLRKFMKEFGDIANVR